MRYSNVLLSVSHPKLKITSCKEIAETLQSCKIPCKVIETHSIIPSRSGSHRYEKGCDILLTNYHHDKIVSTVWKPLQTKYEFDCAYIEIPGGFSGCIYDFMRQSNCPG